MGLGVECGWNRGKHVREAGSETGLVSWGQATGEPQTSGEDFGCHLHSREDRLGKTLGELPLVAQTQTMAVVILTGCITDILCAARTR